MAKKTTNESAKTIEHLPDAELDVLACLWREGDATAGRIREMLKRYRPMAHGSVVTLLVRLERKGFVGKEKGPVGKAFIFKAAKRQEIVYRSIFKEVLLRHFGGDIVKMAGILLDVQPLSATEAQQVQGMLKGKKKSR